MDSPAPFEDVDDESIAEDDDEDKDARDDDEALLLLGLGEPDKSAGASGSRSRRDA